LTPFDTEFVILPTPNTRLRDAASRQSLASPSPRGEGVHGNSIARGYRSVRQEKVKIAVRSPGWRVTPTIGTRNYGDCTGELRAGCATRMMPGLTDAQALIEANFGFEQRRDLRTPTGSK
jgi:hypothetical protein